MTAFAAFRKEILELVRSGRLIVLAAVLVFFGMSSPVLARYTPELLAMVPGAEQFSGLVPEPVMLDAVAQFVKNISQFGILLALLLSMGAVASEVEKGTAALVLVKPLARPVFLLAKFIALGLAFLVVNLLAGLLAYVYTVILFGASPAGAWLGMTLLLWLYMLVYIAVTILFSSLFRSQAAAAGAGFGVLLVLGIAGSIPALGRLLPAELINWSAHLFLPESGTAWPALGVSLGIIVLSLALAVVVFERREL